MDVDGLGPPSVSFYITVVESSNSVRECELISCFELLLLLSVTLSRPSDEFVYNLCTFCAILIITVAFSVCYGHSIGGIRQHF